jgi:hypothetical protein
LSAATTDGAVSTDNDIAPAAANHSRRLSSSIFVPQAEDIEPQN